MNYFPYYLFYSNYQIYTNSIQIQAQITKNSQNKLQAPIENGVSEKKDVLQKKTSQVTLPSQSRVTETQRPVKIKRKCAASKRDEAYGWRNQSKDRNVLSIILKSFLNHLKDGVGIKNYLFQTIQKLRLNIDVSDVYGFIKNHLPIYKAYISFKQIKKILTSIQHSKEVVLVVMLALRQFLKVDLITILATDNKLYSENRLAQIQKSRHLLELLTRK